MFEKLAKSLTLPSFLLIVALAGTMLNGQPAAARGGVEVGMLSCRSLPYRSVNWLVYSSTTVHCVFSTAAGKEYYQGRTGIGLGVDLSWRPQREIHFVVLAASTDVEVGQHALTGYYGGGNVSVSVGASAGVSVLVGGGDKNISLQPLAIETGTGVGAAAGLTYLALEPLA